MNIKKIIPPIWLRIFILLQLIIDIAYPIIEFSFSYQVNLGIFTIFLGLSISFLASHKFREEGVELKPLQEDSAKLITEGLFRFSRNPMYLGMFIALFGVAIALGSLAAFVPVLLYYFLILYVFIKKEEQAMTEQFGEEYTEYCSRVRRWL